MKNLLLAVFGAVLLLIPSVLLAQDERQEKAAFAKNEVVEAAKKFTEGFDDASKRHFNVLYGNYNMIKVVETVRDSVGTAIHACGDDNPDMKTSLDDRFDAWNKAVNPLLEDADANVQNMVLAQEYAKPGDIKIFFKLIDKARAQKDNEAQKIPVTSAQGCQKLLDSMDFTQPNMIKLLRATLVSLPQVIQAEDRAAKAKAEEDARKEETQKTKDAEK